VAVDTSSFIQSNPSLCAASDYCSVNIEPYFAGVSPTDAASFVQTQISAVQSVVDVGKIIVVTEVGWPTEGFAIGSAVPSVGNQEFVIASIKNVVSASLIFYSAFDNLWENTDSDLQSWGILTE